MSEKTCGSCRFWGPTIQFPSEYGVCSKIVFAYNDNWSGPIESTELACVVDSEDIAAQLQCKPDFGCVLWESKRSPADPAGD